MLIPLAAGRRSCIVNWRASDAKALRSRAHHSARRSPLKVVSIVGALTIAAALCSCGGSAATTTDTAPSRDATTSTAPPTAPRSASLLRAARLASAARRPGEIIVKAGGVKNAGPFAFRNGVYRVRFQQFDPTGETDFATEASSLVVQLDRRPGEITGETVHVTNATAENGDAKITTHGGRYYVDISSADQGVVLRFTPR